MGTVSLDTAVLTLKTDATQYYAGIDKAKKEAVGLKQSFEGYSKTLLGLGKDGTASLDGLANAFKNPAQGAKALGAELGTSLVGSMGATVVAGAAVVGAVVAIGAVMTKLAMDAAAAGGALDDASEITGISVERLSGYKFALEVTGGTLEQFTNSIFKMQQRMEENPKEFEEGLKRIGLTAKELEDLTLDEKFLAINTAFREVKPGADQAAAAIALFGKQGRDMIPLLNEDIKGLVDRSKELAMTWSTEDAAAAEDLERKTAELYAVFENLWTGLGNFFIPVLHGIVTAATGVIASLHGMYENVRLLWGEVRNVPQEIKEPKMWRDLADRGIKPVALSMEEATRVAKEMDRELEVTHKKADTRAKEEKERLKVLNEARASNYREELRMAAEAWRAKADLLDRNGLAEMKALEDSYNARVKADAELAEADKKALDGMYTERYRLEQEDLQKSKTAQSEKLAFLKDTFSTMTTAVQGSFAQMALGAKGFKEGFMDIWQSIKAGFMTIVNEMLGTFVNTFIKGALNALTGAKGGFAGAFSGLFSGGSGGLFGGLGGLLGGGGAAAGAGAAGAGAAAAGGAGAAAGGGGAAAGVGGGLGLGATAGLTAGIGGAALLAWAIWKKGLFRGGEEATKVSPARDKFFELHGGTVESLGKKLGDAGLSGEEAEALIKRVFDAQKMEPFLAATEAIEEALRRTRDAAAEAAEGTEDLAAGTDAATDAARANVEQQEKAVIAARAAYEAQVIYVDHLKASGTASQQAIAEAEKAAEAAAQKLEAQQQELQASIAETAEGFGDTSEDAEQSIDDIELNLRALSDFMKRMSDRNTGIFGPMTRGFGTLEEEATESIDAIQKRLSELRAPNIQFDLPPSVIGEGFAMAEGGYGRVTKPTLFLAGEAGPEDVAFSGGGKRFGGSDQAVEQLLRENLYTLESIEAAVRANRVTSVQIEGREVVRASHRVLSNGGELLTEAQELMGVR